MEKCHPFSSVILDEGLKKEGSALPSLNYDF